MFFSKDNRCPKQASANKGHRCVRGQGVEPPGHLRNFQKFSQDSVKNYSVQAKIFEFLKIFNEKFAAFSKVLKNLLDPFAEIWRTL